MGMRPGRDAARVDRSGLATRRFSDHPPARRLLRSRVSTAPRHQAPWRGRRTLREGSTRPKAQGSPPTAGRVVSLPVAPCGSNCQLLSVSTVRPEHAPASRLFAQSTPSGVSTLARVSTPRPSHLTVRTANSSACRLFAQGAPPACRPSPTCRLLAACRLLARVSTVRRKRTPPARRPFPSGVSTAPGHVDCSRARGAAGRHRSLANSRLAGR